jgi:hypothetical protein
MNWQLKGMLMSVKNCSRDVLVSRNSSQMALDESVSTNACENGVLMYRNVFVIAIDIYFRNIYIYVYKIREIFVFKGQ